MCNGGVAVVVDYLVIIDLFNCCCVGSVLLCGSGLQSEAVLTVLSIVVDYLGKL